MIQMYGPGLDGSLNACDFYRRLKHPREVFPDSLPIEARLSRKRTDAKPLYLQILDHNDLYQSYQLDAWLIFYEAWV